MYQPDFGIARPAAPARPASVAAPAAVPSFGTDSSMRFSATYDALRAEIVQTIQTGFEPDEFGSRASASPALSAEARAFLAKQANLDDIGAGVDSAGQRAFLDRIAPWAKQAGQQLGVSPDIIAAQAALESGWGQRPLRQADGSDSHNLFSIKATGGWQGGTADVLTTEFENGTPVKKTETFRSYPSPAEAFNDFARLIQGNPRYQSALNTGDDVRAYGQGLVRGGYATDPAYADKLGSVVQRLRTQP